MIATLMHPTMWRAAWERFTWSMFPVSVFIILMFVASWIEPLAFPPIKNFRVLEVRRDTSVITIKGIMDKARPCELVSITADGLYKDNKVAQRMAITFEPDDGVNKVGEGSSRSWGPWTITLPNKRGLENVVLYSLHSCHFLWSVQTHLATMPVTYISEGLERSHPERAIQQPALPFYPK